MSTDDAAHGEQQPADNTPPASLACGPPKFTAAATEAEFMQLLRTLRLSSGLSYKTLTKRWKEEFPEDAREKSTVGDLFKKDRLPRNPKQLEQVLTLLVQTSSDGPDIVQPYVNRCVEHATRLLAARTDHTPHSSREPAAPAEGELDVARVATDADFMLRLSQLRLRSGLNEKQLAKRWKQRYPQDIPDELELNWWCTGLTVPTWNSGWATRLRQLVTLLVQAHGGDSSEICLWLERGQGVLQSRAQPTTYTEAEYMALLRDLRTQSGITCQHLAAQWRKRFPRCDPPRQAELEEWFASITLPECWGSAVGAKHQRLQPLVTLLVEASGGGPSDIDRYVQLGWGLLARRTQQDPQPTPPARPSQQPPSPAPTGIDDDTPTEPLPVIRIRDQGTGEQRAEAEHTEPEHAEADVTELDPHQPAQQQPKRNVVRSISALLHRGIKRKL